ncbi:MAG: tetratricopeptide repeat protein [Chitinophagaceae bacterium]|nr:tetratricopeptide repeat protein [Chitinophagaceae bacterium]
MKKARKQTPPIKKQQTVVPSSNRLILFFIAAAIAMITFIVFAPALNGSFTNWDDDSYVTSNPFLTSATIDWRSIFTEPVALNYHPLTMITLALNRQAAGFHPHAYLATNILFHVMNSVLVFLFFYFLSGKKIITGTISGILFGIHPMHVESVAWISERKDVLYVFFLLLSLHAYLQYRLKEKSIWLFVSFLFFLLSCLSKAMAVVLPIILILIDYFQQRKLSRLAWLEKIPFLLVSLFFGIIALRIQAASANETVASFTFIQQFFFGCYGCMIYLLKFLFPWSLSAFYPYPVTDSSQSLPFLFYASPMVLIVTAWLVYRYLRKQSFIVFGFLFFLVSIALVLQFITVGNALMADRYSYLSYAGLCFVTGFGFEKIYHEKQKIRPSLLVAAAIIFFLLGYLSHERTKVWHTSETLWSDVISKYPEAATAYKNRGNYYGARGNTAAALNDYKVLLKMNTNDPEVFNNLGNIYADQNKMPESMAAYSKAIALKPDYVNAYINRGISYNTLKQPQKAVDDFSKAIALNGKKATLWAQRGYTYYEMGNYESAISDFDIAVKLQPDLPAAYYCRGLSYYRLSKKEAAARDLMKAKSLGYEGDYSLLK